MDIFLKWCGQQVICSGLSWGKLRNSIPGRGHQFIRKFPSTQCSQIVKVLKVSPKYATGGDENLMWHGGHHVAQFCWIFANQQCWLYDFTISIRYGYARWENEASAVYVCTPLERVKASKTKQVFLLLSWLPRECTIHIENVFPLQVIRSKHPHKSEDFSWLAF